VAEVFLQLLGELLIQLGVSSFSEPFREQRRAHPIMAGVGVLLLGALVGGLTLFVYSTRIFRPGPIRGASLLLSPLVTGALMDVYGDWVERRGGFRSYLATFWGGALFAFGMALVRFFWIVGYVDV
jgi:hypothetical protein